MKNKKTKNKKAQTDILVTVLLVLIALAVVAIVAYFVVNQVRTSTSEAQLKSKNFEVYVKKAEVNDGFLRLSLERGSSTENFTGLKIVMTANGKSQTYNYTGYLNPLETQEISIPLTGDLANSGNIAVDVYPVLIFNSESRIAPKTSGASSVNTNDAFDKSNLIAYWPLDRNGNDYSGNENNITLYGTADPTCTSWDNNGKLGGSVKYGNSINLGCGLCNGIQAGLRTNSTLSSGLKNLNSTGFTISMWINATIVAHPFHFVTPYTCAGGCGSFGGCHSNSNSSNICYSDLMPAQSALATGNWVHYVYVFDKQGLMQKNYINGVINSLGVISGGDYGLVSQIDLGIYGIDCQDATRGSIDEVRIYDRALSAEEIKALYEGNK